MVCIMGYEDAKSMGLRPCGIPSYEGELPDLLEGKSSEPTVDRWLVFQRAGERYLPYGGRDGNKPLDDEHLQEIFERIHPRDWLNVHG